jgi:RNase P subunit RPR2
MQSVNLSEAEFYGKVSTLPRNREVPRTCRTCGSQLGGRRYKGVRLIGGKAVRVWVCDCGHGRRLPVEAAAA